MGSKGCRSGKREREEERLRKKGRGEARKDRAVKRGRRKK